MMDRFSAWLHGVVIVGAALYLVTGQVAAQEPRPATFVVTVPADAELFIDQVRCPLTGESRTFSTGPLDPNRRFQYTLRARADRNGKPVNAARQVTFRGGDRVTVDFGRLESEEPPAIAPGPRIDFGTPPPVPTAPKEGGTSAAPAGATPQFAWARLIGDEVQLMQRLPVVAEQIQTRNVKGPDGSIVPEPFKVKTTKLVATTSNYPRSQVELRSADGGSLSPQAAAERLRRDTLVLVCYDGQSVDPGVLNMVRPETLLLILKPLR
jgi:uncharacterized protein (TIGR03000 family)